MRRILALTLALSLTPIASPANASTAIELRGIDLERATVLDLQTAMNRGRLDSTTLTAFYLRRIGALNPALHAVIETNPHALIDALASDTHRRRHGGRGPLEGIPDRHLSPWFAEFGPRSDIRQPAWTTQMLANYFTPHTPNR